MDERTDGSEDEEALSKRQKVEQEIRNGKTRCPGALSPEYNNDLYGGEGSETEISTEATGKIDIHVHRLEKTDIEEWNDAIDEVDYRFEEHIEDGSGDYETEVFSGSAVAESTLDSYNNESDPDHWDLFDDWNDYVDQHHSQGLWIIHVLLIDFWGMEYYDLSYGGLAVRQSAFHVDGAACWASNVRGVIHEVCHTLIDREHWHHNLGRSDEYGQATVMGAAGGEGCAYLDGLNQPAVDETEISWATAEAVRKFRDEQTYQEDHPECCFEDCEMP